MRKLILFLASILIIGGGVFAFGYKSCEQVAPPKIGQTDSHIIEKDGKLYYCRTLYERIKGISFTNPKLDSVEMVQDGRDETANWETYRNEQYGYQIKYPKDFILEFRGSDPLFLSPKDVLSMQVQDPHFHTFSLFIQQSETHRGEVGRGNTLEEAVKERFRLNEFKEQEPSESSRMGDLKNVDWVRKIFIGDNIKTYFVREWLQSSFNICHYLTKKDNVLIDMNREGRNGCLDDALFNQMLSTFKFTDQNPTSVANRSITVVSPNGGEKWVGGKSYDIVWSYQRIEKVDVWLTDLFTEQTQGGHGSQGVRTIASGVPANIGKYTLIIPSNLRIDNVPISSSLKYLIKITEAGSVPYTCVTCDQSDNYFSIVSP